MVKTKEGFELFGIIRDFKKYTSRQLIKTIEEHPGESRKEWMLSKFRHAGAFNSNKSEYQFWQQNNKPIELWSVNVIQQKLD
jgi:hypothetical protein